jgi:hypothetical protein
MLEPVPLKRRVQVRLFFFHMKIWDFYIKNRQKSSFFHHFCIKIHHFTIKIRHFRHFFTISISKSAIFDLFSLNFHQFPPILPLFHHLYIYQNPPFLYQNPPFLYQNPPFLYQFRLNFGYLPPIFPQFSLLQYRHQRLPPRLPEAAHRTVHLLLRDPGEFPDMWTAGCAGLDAVCGHKYDDFDDF